MRKNVTILLLFSFIIQILLPFNDLVFADEKSDGVVVEQDNGESESKDTKNKILDIKEINENKENPLAQNSNLSNSQEKDEVNDLDSENESNKESEETNNENKDKDSQDDEKSENEDSLIPNNEETNKDHIPEMPSLPIEDSEETEEEVEQAEVTEPKNLGNIFSFVSLTVNGSKVEPGSEIVYEDNLEVKVDYNWSLNDDVDLKSGDYALFEIPGIFKNGVINGVIRDKNGNIVGNYNNNDDGSIIKFIFNSELENKTNRSGKFWTTLNLKSNIFGENDEKLINFEDNVSFTFVRENDKGQDIKKTGAFDNILKPKEINWVIDVNTKLGNLTNPIIKDDIESGQELVGKIKVYSLNISSNGTPTKGKLIGEYDKFPIGLSPGRKAYRIEYRTKITDPNQTVFSNTATLIDGDKSVDSKFELNRGESGPYIEKKGKISGDKKSITWNIFVNKRLDHISDAVVYDEIPEGLNIKENSIKVYKLKQDGANFSRDGAAIKTHSDFPVNLGEITSAYEIEFETDIDYDKFDENGFAQNPSFKNEASIVVDGNTYEDDATVKIDRSKLISKKGKEVVDYNRDNPVIEWTITVNESQAIIPNAKVVDTIGDGQKLIPGSMKMKKGKGNEKFTDINPTVNDNGFTVDLGNIDDVYTIVYRVEVTDKTSDKYTNDVELTSNGKEIGEDNGKTVTISRKNTFKKEKEKNGSIDYEKKTMGWLLTIDANKQKINSGFKIKETYHPAKSMFLVDNSLEIKKDGSPFNDYTLTDDGVEGFKIVFNSELEKGKYTISFRTSFDPIQVHEKEGIVNTTNEYTNKVNFSGHYKNDEEINVDDEATQSIKEEFSKQGKKIGSFDEDNEKQINWKVYLNALGEKIEKKYTVTDTLGDGQKLVQGSIKVYQFSLSGNGNYVKGGEIAGYNLQNEEDGGFTIVFENGIDSPVLIEYSSEIIGIAKKKYTNIANVSYGDFKEDYTGEVNYSNYKLITKSSDVSGGKVYEGQIITWDVVINSNLSDIKNGIFKDIINKGHSYVDDSLIIYDKDNNNITSEFAAPQFAAGDNSATILTIDLGDFNYKIRIQYKTEVLPGKDPIKNEAYIEGHMIEGNNSSEKRYEMDLSSGASGDGEDRINIKAMKEWSENSPENKPTIKFQLYRKIEGGERQPVDVPQEPVNNQVMWTSQRTVDEQGNIYI